MPYRRLPKTDQARIRALKAAVESSTDNGVFTNVLSHNTYHRAKNFLERFSNEVALYRRCVAEQSSKRGNVEYEAALRKARMYVSHFIQVLSMSIMRGEITRNKRPYYGLPENEDTVPNLFSESSVLEWGVKIIEGERRRQGEGGVPIYNPTMGRVSVVFELFKGMYEKQQALQARTNSALQNISEMRFEADEIIFEAWGEIEKAFSVFQGEERLKRCAEYGVIYYDRPDRKAKKQEEND
ncbi:MAG: hypothetical protein IKA52_04875 [Bacteroidaceae bacterium]|nr:hypothetical protein [Bacteroidaceae bacterium]